MDKPTGLQNCFEPLLSARKANFYFHMMRDKGWRLKWLQKERQSNQLHQ
jgi:hypothetical protein